MAPEAAREDSDKGAATSAGAAKVIRRCTGSQPTPSRANFPDMPQAHEEEEEAEANHKTAAKQAPQLFSPAPQ